MKWRFTLLFIICSNFYIVHAQQILKGKASFYHNKFNGRKTATGEIFSNNNMTCACNQLKLGTYIKVTNLKNNKTIIVKVNDRLAATNHRLVDLTYTAAKKLNFINAGLANVKIEVLTKNTRLKKTLIEEAVEN